MKKKKLILKKTAVSNSLYDLQNENIPSRYRSLSPLMKKKIRCLRIDESNMLLVGPICIPSKSMSYIYFEMWMGQHVPYFFRLRNMPHQRITNNGKKVITYRLTFYKGQSSNYGLSYGDYNVCLGIERLTRYVIMQLPLLGISCKDVIINGKTIPFTMSMQRFNSD